MLLQTFSLLENIYFHIILTPILLFGIFFYFKHLYKMEWNSIELKVTLLIILTTLIIVEFIVLILEIVKDNLLYYLLSFTPGFIAFVYLLHFTIKSIILYSKNLLLAKEEIENSQRKYKNAYNNAELYKDVFAHDISNMLQNLTFSIDFLNHLFDQNKNDKNFQEIMNTSKNEIIRGTELVSNVRLLSNLDVEESKLKNVNVISLLKELINDVYQMNLCNNLKIEIDALNQKAIVFANNNLYHLFKNLILNGINHNDNPYKEILVKIRNVEKNYDNYFRIEIIDNGRGLNPQLKDIYTGFFNNDQIDFRSGLGLLVVKRLISIYKGLIFIDDRIKYDHTQGTKMIIYLPKTDLQIN